MGVVGTGMSIKKAGTSELFVDGIEWIEDAKSSRNTGPAANRTTGWGYSGMILVADACNPGFVRQLLSSAQGWKQQV